jgi:hypothetical protein
MSEGFHVDTATLLRAAAALEELELPLAVMGTEEALGRWLRDTQNRVDLLAGNLRRAAEAYERVDEGAAARLRRA